MLVWRSNAQGNKKLAGNLSIIGISAHYSIFDADIHVPVKFQQLLARYVR